MNDNNFQRQESLDGNYINIALPPPLNLDKIAIRAIKESCPDFLLPFRMTDINDEITLKYKTPNTFSLQYMNEWLDEQMFLKFYEGLLEPFIKGYDWFLDYHYVCINPEYIYVDKKTAKPSFIYIPEQSYFNEDDEIVAFLQKAMNKVSHTVESAFLIRLYQYFNSGNVVISDLYEMIKNERNKNNALVIDPVPQAAVSEPIMNVMPSSESNQQPPEQSNASSKDGIMGELFNLESKKKPKKEKKPKEPKEKKQRDKQEKKGIWGSGLFGKNKEKPSEQPIPEMQTPPPIQQISPPPVMDINQYTEIPANIAAEDISVTETEDSRYRTESCLELADSEMAGAIARISLDFPNAYITLGRESDDAVKPDICFDKTFRQISRMHLRIERNGDDYYAIDLGSGNHTMLDGQIMMPNMQYKLQAGMTLTLAANKRPVRYRVNI